MAMANEFKDMKYKIPKRYGDYLEKCIEDILYVISLEHSNFNGLGPVDYPTGPDNVDAFVKDRIREWLGAYVQKPLEDIRDTL